MVKRADKAPFNPAAISDIARAWKDFNKTYDKYCKKRSAEADAALLVLFSRTILPALQIVKWDDHKKWICNRVREVAKLVNAMADSTANGYHVTTAADRVVLAWQDELHGTAKRKDRVNFGFFCQTYTVAVSSNADEELPPA